MPRRAATLGENRNNICTPKGFRNCGTVLRNPFGVERNMASLTQGSRYAATLGCPTKVLRAMDKDTMLESSQQLLDSQMLARLQALPLHARQTVEGYTAGVHRSPFRGFSIEFAEHREYSPGDDLRYLDWKVFGRTDKYYLKQYEEETNLVCHLLLDTSQSMCYQSDAAPMSKLDYARRAAAALAYLVLHQQDSVGMVAFDSEIRSFIRASSNPSHLKEILHVMERAAAERKTSIGPIFHDLSERIKRRGIVIVLSDLFDDVDSMMTGLKHLRHRRHEVVLMHVLDPAEVDFPFDRVTMFRGLENRPDVLIEPRAIRKAYLAEFARYRRRLQSGCRELAIDYVPMRTDESLEVVLASYLASRG